jgi:E3 ubiquitin-protein ligase EDD1
MTISLIINSRLENDFIQRSVLKTEFSFFFLNYYNIFPFVNQIHVIRPNLAPKITGMLLELPPPQLLILLASEDTLKQRVDEAVDIILTHSRDISGEALLDLDVFNFSKTSGGTTTVAAAKKSTVEGEDSYDDDNSPLFYQPGKRGFFSPRLGKPTAERLNAFRNVGR